ncbi:MAG: RDD family protein [Bacteroidota bacterium]
MSLTNENPITADSYADSDVKLVAASKNKRFANYMLDLLFYALFAFGMAVLYYSFIDSGDILLEETTTLNDYIFQYTTYLAYYAISEILLGGRTLGKMITKTRVVDFEGKQPKPITIIGRSLARLIPFDALSFLAKDKGGWHDDFSKTMVIDMTKSHLGEENNWEDDIIDANL